MPKLKPGIIWPTPEEDAQINAGIAADPDNFELNAAWVARARPASEVLPEQSGALVAKSMLKPRGKRRRSMS